MKSKQLTHKIGLSIYSLILISLGAFIQSNCGEGTAVSQTSGGNAAVVAYDNSSSGMSATTVQAAIDELRALLKVASRTDISTLLVGTWKGQEFDGSSISPDSPSLQILSDDVEITFNSDNSYVCQNLTVPGYFNNPVCPSGTWSLFGNSIHLTAGSKTSALTIGSISENRLLTLEDDIPESFGILALAKQ
jgi:lipocalin-like protein